MSRAQTQIAYSPIAPNAKVDLRRCQASAATFSITAGPIEIALAPQSGNQTNIIQTCLVQGSIEMNKLTRLEMTRLPGRQIRPRQHKTKIAQWQNNCLKAEIEKLIN